MKPNWVNRTLWTGDNLDIMRGMNSESVDLIYLDPPFNSNKNYSAPIRSEAAGAAFKDTWTLSDVDVAWHGEIAERYPALYAISDAAGLAHSKGMKAYLIMMAIRLLEMKRILRQTGSIYLHCDSTASHYLKLTMDYIFGYAGLRNEIVWCYHGPGSPRMRQFNRKTDTILWYSKGEKWTFNSDDIRVPYKDPKQTLRKRMSTTGSFTMIEAQTQRARGKIPENWWVIRIAPRSKKEYLGYPTQKPIELLTYIIKASSNKNDVILDPFCGCATTLIASENLNRSWVGIDLSPKAAELVKLRLQNHLGLFYEIIHRDDIPKRTDQGKLSRLSDTQAYIIRKAGGSLRRM